MTDPELAEDIRAKLEEAFPEADVRRSAQSIVPVAVIELSGATGDWKPLILVYPASGSSESREARGRTATLDHAVNVLVAGKVNGTDVEESDPLEALTERVREFLRGNDVPPAKWLRATAFVPQIPGVLVYLNGMTEQYRSIWMAVR